MIVQEIKVTIHPQEKTNVFIKLTAITQIAKLGGAVGFAICIIISHLRMSSMYKHGTLRLV